MDTFSALDSKAFLTTFLENKVRPDGRLFLSSRPTSITTGILTRNAAAGSALVTMGNTQVLAAISLLVGTPAAEFGEDGDLTVITTSSSHYYATWLERVLRTSDLMMLDMKKSLCILPNKAAWRVQVILQVLNDDGNIRDCMLLAAVAALSNAKLPPVVVDKQDGIVSIVQEDENHFVTKLCGGDDDSSTNNIPIPLTVGFVQLDNKKEEMTILVDPTRLEEEHCDSTCCIVVTAGAANNMNNTTNRVVNCEVSGRVAISSQQLALVAQMAKGRARELFELLT
jgi:exosome complex RNA-binding protein Rrp42 (RNase PH superfamily)